MPGALEFDVFGQIMVAERSGDGWRLFVLGNEGKRSPSGVAVPEFIHEHELAQYLDDLFHEMATRDHPRVVPIP